MYEKPNLYININNPSIRTPLSSIGNFIAQNKCYFVIDVVRNFLAYGCKLFQKQQQIPRTRACAMNSTVIVSASPMPF